MKRPDWYEEEDWRTKAALRRIKKAALAAQEQTDDDMSWGWLGSIKAICDFGMKVMDDTNGLPWKDTK